MNIEASIWDKIAQLKPKLRNHAQFTCQYYRGQEWYVLADSISGGHFRCPAPVHQFLQMLDGQLTIQSAFDSIVQTRAGHAPSQEDILSIIATLQNKDLLEGDMPQSANELYQRYDTITKKTKFQRWSRPLSIKLSLWDPDLFLEKVSPYFKLLFSKAFFILIMAVILYGGVIALSHWQDLVEHFSVRFMDAQNLLLIWLIYPLVKLIHELGHAIATKYWGGEVHDMGLLFIVFIPIPYVDASSSHQFPNKHHRMVVAGAGILVELLLAATAVFIWLNLEDGLARDIAFNVAVIGGLSSLLVNGNPLLRFDGYYVLSDAIEIPNLSTRSTQYLGHLSQRLLLGLDDLASPVRAKGERAWFVFYGVAAGIYKLFISFSIALFVSTSYLLIGVILALWYFIQQLLMPTFNALKSLFIAAGRHKRVKRLCVSSSIFCTLFYLVLFIIPIQNSIQIEGVIALPEDAIIRAQVDGFLREVVKNNTQEVSKGDVLFYFENDELYAKARLIEAKLLELQARENVVSHSDQIQSQILKEEILQAQAALDNTNEKIAKLALVSPATGSFSIQSAQDMPGRFYRKGDVLAYVVNLSEIKINAVIPQDKLNDLDLSSASDKQNDLAAGKQKVEVKLKSDPAQTLDASMGRSVPQASFQLPLAELGTSRGGNIMVDSRDETGLTTIEAIYQIEVALPEYKERYLAAKVDIKIQHTTTVLAEYIFIQFRQLLVDKFQY